MLFLSYKSKFKEIEVKACNFLRDFPKFVKALSVEFLFLQNIINIYKIHLLIVSLFQFIKYKCLKYLALFISMAYKDFFI